MQSYIKAKKNQLNIFRLLKIITFLAILTFLVFRFLSLKDEETFSINLENTWPFITALCLIPLNWFFEFQKWQLCTDAIDGKVSARSVWNSFLAGMITGLMTPNMIGNFLGRMYYIDREDRGVITLLTLISNQSQFIITLLLGVLSLIIVPFSKGQVEFNFAIWVSVGFVTSFGVFAYFRIEKILQFFSRTKRLGQRLERVLKRAVNFRIKVLLLSLVRYLVFITQFSLVLISFGADFEPILLLRIAQVYLISALIPTLILGKLGVRESIGIVILGSMGIPEFTILIASLSIWCVNLMIPTLLATLLIKRNFQ